MTAPWPAGPGIPDTATRLLEQARSGSGEALGELLQLYRPYLLQIADAALNPRLRAKAGASDLVQQSFLEAQTSFERFQGTTEAELVSWLRCILECNLADFNRRFLTVAMRQVHREVPLNEDNANPVGLQGLASSDPTPSADALAREQAAVLEQALGQLPDDYRQVIVLRNHERRSFAEIGALLDRSAEAARKLWARAVERLQQELGDRA